MQIRSDWLLDGYVFQVGYTGRFASLQQLVRASIRKHRDRLQSVVVSLAIILSFNLIHVAPGTVSVIRSLAAKLSYALSVYLHNLYKQRPKQHHTNNN